MARAGPGSSPWEALAPAALGHSGEDHWQSSLENLCTHLWRMPGVGPGRVTRCQIPQYNSWIGLGKLQELYRRAVLCSVTSNSFATSWSIACQAPLSTGFSGQEFCRLPFPPLGDLPDPEIKFSSLVSPAIGRQILLLLNQLESHRRRDRCSNFHKERQPPCSKPKSKAPQSSLRIHPSIQGWKQPYHQGAFSPGQWLLCR